MDKAINQKKILIFTGDQYQKTRDDLDLLGGSSGGVVTVGELRESLQEMMPVLDALISDLKNSSNERIKFYPEEVSISLGINGKGKIGFLGTGAEVGGEASLTLKFKI